MVFFPKKWINQASSFGSKLVIRSQKDYFGKWLQVFFPKNNFYMQMKFWMNFFVTCFKKYLKFPQCIKFFLIVIIE
jgi:hypothetical protein